MVEAGEWRPPPVRRIVMLLPLALLALFSFFTAVDARSPHPPPLRRIHRASASTLEILPRRNNHPSLPYRSRSTPYPHQSSLKHSDTFFLTLTLPSLLPQDAILLLRPTENLIHPNAKITYAGGATEPLRPEDWRLYTGDVISPKWKDRLIWEESSGFNDERTNRLASLGSARVMVHESGNGDDREPIFEGVFTVDGIDYNVLTTEHYERVKTDSDIASGEMDGMIVFRNADSWHETQPTINGQQPLAPHTTCNHDFLPFNSNLSHPVNAHRYEGDFLNNVFKRDDTGGMSGSSNYINSIGNPAGCPSSQQVVYMGVALDCNYIQTYGSPSAARTQVLNNWNQISALYRSTFNISIGIIDLVVQNQTCPSQAIAGTEWDVNCDANLTLDQRLSSFSQWRGNKGEDGAGLWHLMSACPTDSEVGVAWLGTLCQTTSNLQSGSYVSGTGISTATKTEWSLVAHEIGHGFGAIHDCTSGCSLSGGCCPLSSSTCDAGGSFIMNPTTSQTEEKFSSCTLGNICSGLGSRLVSSSCLSEPGSRTTISLQQCGNGIVDAGEECDPGLNGNSTCCDATTCKFVSGAVCDPSNSACCTGSCQYASAGTVCRTAVDATCDFAETCTGNNATCPADRTADDGTSCGSDGLACASGRCTSLDQQCRSAGGSMNLTTACGQRNDRSCVVTCRDPGTSNQCVVLQTPLLDGSPCGYGGHCYNQTCQSGSWQSTAAHWYTENLQISIPVTIVVGLLALGILVALLRCCFRSCGARRKPNRGVVPVVVPPQMSQRHSAFNNPAAVNHARHSDSVSSQDPINHTGVISRDPSPAGGGYGEYQGVPNASPPRHPQSQAGGAYLAPQPNGYNGYNGSNGGAGGGYGYNGHNNAQPGGWVDERLYNGQNYGRDEAWGR